MILPSLLTALMLGGLPSPVTLRVSPQQAFEPVKVTATVIVEPDPRNREMCVSYHLVAEGSSESADCRSWNGAQERRTTEFYFILGWGDYEFQAAVKHEDGEWVRSKLLRVHVESKQ